MTSGRFAVTIAAFIVVALSGCHRRPAATPVIPVPNGLDSVGVQRWLAAQRKACRGHLVTARDEGAFHNFDSTSIPEYRYRIGLVGVQCLP